MTIMGRGRTGFGYTRKSHVIVKVDTIDFPKMIAEAKTNGLKKKWANRWAEVQKLKNQVPVVPLVPAEPAAAV